MNLTQITSLYLFAIVCLISCKKKETEVVHPIASIQIVNAVVSGSTLRLGTTNPTIGNGANLFASFDPGKRQVKLTSYFNAGVVYYDEEMDFEPSASYSLYLHGNSTAIEATLVKNIIPKRTDLSFGVRFVNLFNSTTHVSVNLIGKPIGSEVEGLNYKESSAFINISAGPTELSRTFEFRDTTSGTVLASITLDNITPSVVYKNITLVLRGTTGANGQVIRVNNYQ